MVLADPARHVSLGMMRLHFFLCICETYKGAEMRYILGDSYSLRYYVGIV
jgi:hypothetical protein